MKKKFLQGTIKRHPDGFGFFIPDNSEHPDVYIPRHSMKSVMTNDRVMVEVSPEKGGDRFRGDIIKIISRGLKNVVGAFQVLNEQWGFVRDEGKGWGEDLRIKIQDSMGAKKGELVSVEIISFPEEGEIFQGRVKEIIGSTLDPLTDIKRVLVNNHIPHEFTQSTMREAAQFTEHVSEQDLKGRKDLRALRFITIDGATAKDFDDAIYVETNSRGFLLYVAIADVSHYVRLGSAIDQDAYERGTSVYFPGFVVPMLPEVLSNGLCSLNPHLPRLSLVAEMQMDFTGEMLESKFYEAVIESKARVTYGEAQEVIDGAEVEKLSHVKEDILRAADLAKILMAKRFKEGALELEIPEVQMVLDGSGVPVDMIRSERLFAHRLIEEMMLAANVAVGKFLFSEEVPALYRVHEPPHEDAIEMLQKYLWNFGSKSALDGGILQKKLTRALQEFEGKPESQVLNILALRSMSQAKYSPDNVGHFGLGFEFYTHFTSPIRRYPDLIVHRLIKNRVMPNSQYRLMGEDDLATAGTILSACEQRAVKSERQFVAIKKARFMEKHLGEEFEGIISSVAKFGIFVLLRTFEVDGLIRLENLSHGKLFFDEDNLILKDEKSGMTYGIGDAIKIRVVRADIDAGQVDFELANGPQKAKATSPGSEQRHPPKQNREKAGKSSSRQEEREPQRQKAKKEKFSLHSRFKKKQKKQGKKRR